MHYLNFRRIYTTLSKLHLVLSRAAKKINPQLIFHNSNPVFIPSTVPQSTPRKICVRTSRIFLVDRPFRRIPMTARLSDYCVIE